MKFRLLQSSQRAQASLSYFGSLLSSRHEIHFSKKFNVCRVMSTSSTTSNSSDATAGDATATTAATTANAPANPVPLLEASKKSYFQRLYDRYSLSQQTNKILVAESYLQAALHQASDPRWYGPGRIPPNEFRPHHALITMHIWFLHKRLISAASRQASSNDNDNDNIQQQDDPHMAALVQEELFDILWTDTTCRMRAHGVNEWMISKHLQTVQQYTFLHCFHYDHCYTGELLLNPKYRFKELKRLIKRHILLVDPDQAIAPEGQDKIINNNNNNNNDDETIGNVNDLTKTTSSSSSSKLVAAASDDYLTRMAWYIETQYQNIVHDWPMEHYQNGNVSWVDLPNFDNLKDNFGNVVPNVPIPTDNDLPSPWVRNIANTGEYYYWNTETREATWERPK